MTSKLRRPTWGQLIQERRESRGMSIRQAALLADISDAYWGQLEKGFVTVRGEQRPVHPKRGVLLQIAAALRFTDEETASLLGAAGHGDFDRGRDRALPRGYDVDLSGLSRRDVALLNAIADRLRETGADVQTATGAGKSETALRAVARQRPASAGPKGGSGDQ